MKRLAIVWLTQSPVAATMSISTAPETAYCAGSA